MAATHSLGLFISLGQLEPEEWEKGQVRFDEGQDFGGSTEDT